ncbi:hypothetical protein [Streptomyces sp. RG80]|uniref:hypothetical protein n=1 Tax=Streptomyces sp. RG80 TaxID=3157340 RepID=UPI00338F986D
MTDRPDGEIVLSKTKPVKRGYDTATKDVFFIAAPLFTAASLSLAGVVAGAADKFLVAGLTLLLLVGSSLSLIAAIQMNYHARQYLFSAAELTQELKTMPAWAADVHNTELARHVQKEHLPADHKYREIARRSVHCYNIGLLLLGLGVACALAPRDCGEVARWVACGMVLAATIGEAVWIYYLIFKASERLES